MTIGHVYQLIDRQGYLGQEVLNVYWYQAVLGADHTSADVIEAFTNDILPKLVDCQTSQIAHFQVDCVNYANPEDYTVGALSYSGTKSATVSTSMPSYIALAFRLNRDIPGHRSGQKRIAGILDTEVDGNDYTGSLTPLQLFAVALGNTIEGSYGEYALFVPKRPVTLGTNPTGYICSSVTFQGLTSQVSRRPVT